MRRISRKQSALVVFVVLAIAPFVVDATMSSFWDVKHSMAPEVTLLYLLLLAAAVVWRYRWAWIVLALFYGSAVLSWPFDSHLLAMSHLLWEVVGLATFGLLISPAVRGRLRRPIRFRV